MRYLSRVRQFAWWAKKVSEVKTRRGRLGLWPTKHSADASLRPAVWMTLHPLRKSVGPVATKICVAAPIANMAPGGFA